MVLESKENEKRIATLKENLENLKKNISESVDNLKKVASQSDDLLNVVKESGKSDDFAEFCENLEKQSEDYKKQIETLSDRSVLVGYVLTMLDNDEKLSEFAVTFAKALGLER